MESMGIMCTKLKLDFGTVDGTRKCGSTPEILQLAFRFPPDSHTTDHRLIGGSILIRQLSLSLEFKFFCFGWDLLQFTQALREFHSRLDGTAEFANQEESVILRLYVVDADRGSIAVRVSLRQHAMTLADAPRLEFCAFNIDQSYLCPIANQIDSFLSETGVGVNHPMT